MGQVGELVGAAVTGAAVVGDADGLLVGWSDGSLVVIVGDALGWSDGSLVAIVGDALGWSDADALG